MKKLISIFIITIFSFFEANAQVSELPEWFVSSFKINHLDQKYALKSLVKPTMLQADFNGDGSIDIATIITDIKSHKKGIIIIESKNNHYFIFGAGYMLGKLGFDGSDDLKWMSGWKVYTKHIVYESQFNDGDIVGSKKRKIAYPGVNIWASEDGEPSAGGIIYWTGKKWDWIHQGE